MVLGSDGWWRGEEMKQWRNFRWLRIHRQRLQGNHFLYKKGFGPGMGRPNRVWVASGALSPFMLE